MPRSAVSLFRQEAFTQKATSIFGASITVFSTATSVAALIALMCAVGLILLLVFGTYERRERVRGYIAPMDGMVRIVPPRLGIVRSLEVIEGEDVVADQALLSISSLRTRTDGADADTVQIAALGREQLNIHSRMAWEGELAEARSQDAERRILELERQAKKLQRQRILAEERAELLSLDLERLESLEARAHVSVSLLDERRGDVLAAQQNVTALAREFEILQSAIASSEAERAMIPLQLGVRHDELGARLLEIERMLTEAEVQRETVVRAPVSGRVTSLVAFPGQSVTPGQTMLAILPDDSRMQAVLLVPSQAAGFIRRGQQVRLRYDAFPHQRFGVHTGVVESVSRTMLKPGDEVGPLRLQMPAYRVIAGLDSESVMAYGEPIPLQPDMTLQADVVRERMRIIEWIFDPVRAAVSAL